MEALAQLETGKSLPLGQQPKPIPPYSKEIRAIHLIWPGICFVVRGSTMVHGLRCCAHQCQWTFYLEQGREGTVVGSRD